MTQQPGSPEAQAADIADRIAALPPAEGGRHVIAIAGPPGAGKSTISESLLEALSARGINAGLVPMDGFHLDNSVIEPLGLLPRKGAPETFDLPGFTAVVSQLARTPDLSVPVFDRTQDRAVPDGRRITPDMPVVLVEGNYLLLDEPGWRDLAQYWGLSVFLEVPTEILEARLVQRWLDHGMDITSARARALSNDIPNARRINENRVPADVVISG